ncbi:MAG TPA: cupin domain-containing protein, partial [Chlorobiota bacterium]|nr:cupin domain-containing protein [Chlorobiota bacterium]
MARTLHNKLDRIAQLGLQPHPEGGYYAETFRSSILTPTSRGIRPASTAIWFLLGTDDVSTFHRLAHEEHWCWHEGLPVTLHVINEEGDYSTTTIGSFDDGYLPALVIPANVWFGASVVPKEFSGRILPESEDGQPKEFSGSILPESEEGQPKEFSGSILPESEDGQPKEFSGSILPESEDERPKEFSGSILPESEDEQSKEFSGSILPESEDEQSK